MTYRFLLHSKYYFFYMLLSLYILTLIYLYLIFIYFDTQIVTELASVSPFKLASMSIDTSLAFLDHVLWMKPATITWRYSTSPREKLLPATNTNLLAILEANPPVPTSLLMTAALPTTGCNFMKYLSQNTLPISHKVEIMCLLLFKPLNFELPYYTVIDN